MKFEARHIRSFALLFAAVVTILAILWFSLLRTQFVPAYQNIRETDAAQIAAALDKAGIAYRLENGGQDILVPEESAAEARVAVAGADVSLGGTVGFELFNDSDMGLTEFAQKINFQRAMQGELSRTIMMMEGVDFARVHLAIPERSIFRSDQGTTTAAVTVEMLPGSRLTTSRILGIQQLIASSVPGLETFEVAVLDETGDLVSSRAGPQGTGLPPLTERDALENFFAAKATRAIRNALPGLTFEVAVSMREVSEFESETETMPMDSEHELRGEPTRDGMALRTHVRTTRQLGPEERGVIERALVATLSLDDSRGDVLVYGTGPLNSEIEPPDMSSAGIAKSAVDAPGSAASAWDVELDWRAVIASRWGVILLLALGLVALVVWPRRRLSDEQASEFAQLLKNVGDSSEKRDAA